MTYSKDKGGTLPSTEIHPSPRLPERDLITRIDYKDEGCMLVLFAFDGHFAPANTTAVVVSSVLLCMGGGLY